MPVRFYTLMPTNEPVATQGAPSESATVVVVGPVTIPAALDQPQLVISTGGHEVEVLEEHRWAAPLKDEITSALAARLSGLVGSAMVTAYGQSAALDPNVRIFVDVSRFELRPKKEVVLDALWTIKSNGSAKESRRGRTNLAVPASNDDYAGLASAQGRALDALARDIAAALRAL
jgi:uncharacterized lipoprotein YmbA